MAGHRLGREEDTRRTAALPSGLTSPPATINVIRSTELGRVVDHVQEVLEPEQLDHPMWRARGVEYGHPASRREGAILGIDQELCAGGVHELELAQIDDQRRGIERLGPQNL